jgi:hypothetical protein
VIASHYCGEVVTDGYNGRLMDTVTADSIEKMLRWAIQNPDSLGNMAARTFDGLANFEPERVVDSLLSIVEGRL